MKPVFFKTPKGYYAATVPVMVTQAKKAGYKELGGRDAKRAATAIAKNTFDLRLKTRLLKSVGMTLADLEKKAKPELEPVEGLKEPPEKPE